MSTRIQGPPASTTPSTTHPGGALSLAGAPDIPGLRFRRFAGPADYPGIVAVTRAGLVADGVDERPTVEQVAADWDHPVNWDPYRDAVIAEIDGVVVGHQHGSWSKRTSGERTYESRGHVHPAWRRRGLGRAMLRAAEAALRAVAETHPVDGPRFFSTWAYAEEAGTIALFAAEGYAPVRWFFEMERTPLEDIPELALPEGVELRPVREAEIERILAADNEAFRDHWGHREATPEEAAAYLAVPETDPSLWRVAWDGDEVVGSVLNIIFPDENRELGAERGWLESVSVRRPWRRRGVARALIAASLRVLRERGMTSAVLGVDSENPSGALGLYEGLGFVQVRHAASYRKPMR